MRKFANRMWNSPHLGVPEKLCSVQCGISLWHDLHYYTVHSFPSLSEVTVFWVTVCKDSHAEWWLEHCLVYGPRHHPTYPHICAEVCIGMGKACIYLAHHWTATTWRRKLSWHAFQDVPQTHLHGILMLPGIWKVLHLLSCFWLLWGCLLQISVGSPGPGDMARSLQEWTHDVAGPLIPVFVWKSSASLEVTGQLSF